MPALEKRTATHWILLIALVVFWGSSFAMTKLAVSVQSPEWTVAIRLLVGAALIWGVMAWQGISLPSGWHNWKWFVWLGTIGSLIPFLLISWGTQYISSGLSGVLMAVIPLFIAISGHYFLADEALTKSRLIGLVIGFLGLILLLSPTITDGLPQSFLPLLAQLAILFAALSYGLQALTARLSPVMHPLQKAAGTHITAAISGLVIAFLFDPIGFTTLNFEGIGFSAALGVFSTGLAGIILFYLLEKAGAGFVSLSNYLLSPYAYLLGIFLLAEPLRWQSFAGLIIILAGITLSEQKQQ